VWPHNAAAIALYRKVGFQVEGRRRRQYRRRNGELWDAILMGLVLDEVSPGSPHPDRLSLEQETPG
jgi:RimJ/RimL family protein N-acetyltransferase